MSKFRPRVASQDRPSRKRTPRNESTGLGAAVPCWLATLRNANFDLRRVPEAQRRAGELLRELEKNRGAVKGKTGSKGKPVLDDRPKLCDLGVTKT